MTLPPLRTKFYIPPNPAGSGGALALIERLDVVGRSAKLMLISVLAGAEKTTLLSAWITGRDRPAAFLDCCVATDPAVDDGSGVEQIVTG